MLKAPRYVSNVSEASALLFRLRNERLIFPQEIRKDRKKIPDHMQFARRYAIRILVESIFADDNDVVELIGNPRGHILRESVEMPPEHQPAAAQPLFELAQK